MAIKQWIHGYFERKCVRAVCLFRRTGKTPWWFKFASRIEFRLRYRAPKPRQPVIDPDLFETPCDDEFNVVDRGENWSA